MINPSKIINIIRKTFRFSKKKIKIGNYVLKLNKDHLLPQFINKFPNYSSNIGRVAKYISEKYKDIVIFDVGSNVGDTAAFIRNQIDSKIVCFEGNPEFFKLLKLNIQKMNNIDLFNIYLGDKDCESSYEIIEKNGTSNLFSTIKKRDSKRIIFSKLDTFIKNYNEYKKVKLLKIDTDGFDLKIISGANIFINEIHPIIFFEFDRRLTTDNLIETINELRQIGYYRIIFYDNFGNFLLTISVSEIEIIENLIAYISLNNSRIIYFDICIFHIEDEDLFKSVIGNEKEYYSNFMIK
ncbi:MAG TPA: hypothetical protein DHV28_15215 [Ignavibacteriales bacterium]|nr:hypothetical protein [Ignavibacteriales bacterium]